MTTRLTPPPRKLFSISVSDLLIFFCFAGYVVFMPQIQEFDIWLHLKCGELLFSGIFPDKDLLSFTAAGKPWNLHEWGSEALFFVLFDRFGAGGLIVLRAMMAALTLGCVYHTLKKSGLHTLLALVLTLVAGILFDKAWGLRPHLFSLFFLALTVYIYHEYKNHGRTRLLAWLPLIFLLWINLHGGFVVGFLFLGICIAGEAINGSLNSREETFFKSTGPLLLWTGAAFAAAFANPYTYRGVLYPLLYSGESALPLYSVAEWHPASWIICKSFIFYVCFVIAVFALSEKRLKPGHLLFFLVFGLYAFRYHRITPFFAAVTLPFVAGRLQELINQAKEALERSNFRLYQKSEGLRRYLRLRSRQLAFLNHESKGHLLLIVVLSAFCLSILFSGKINSLLLIGINKHKYPLENIQYLKTHAPEGYIFNQYRWGGLISWAIPGKKVFIDGRIDVYKNQIADEYYTVMQLHKGWRRILEKYNITHILMQPQTPLARHITELDRNWKLVSDDGVSRLFFKIADQKNSESPAECGNPQNGH